jgi:hypothetical protein
MTEKEVRLATIDQMVKLVSNRLAKHNEYWERASYSEAREARISECEGILAMLTGLTADSLINRPKAEAMAMIPNRPAGTINGGPSALHSLNSEPSQPGTQSRT